MADLCQWHITVNGNTYRCTLPVHEGPHGKPKRVAPAEWVCECQHTAGDHLPAPFLPCGECACTNFRRVA